jgi:hypothetical protein
MKTMLSAGFAIVSVLICLGSIGCERQSLPDGWGGRVVGWLESQPDAELVPGIDSASVYFGTLGKGSAVTLWSDGGGNFGASWDRSRKLIKYEGKLRARDGREYPVQCLTADGKTGSVTIDGQTFQLDNGALFLIATAGAKTTVKQLQRGPLKPEKDALRDMALTDPEIKSFFEASRNSP